MCSLTLPATHKLAYYLTRRRMRDQLLGFLTWQLDQKVATIPVVRRHGRLLADLPYRTDKELKIPARVYRPYWRDLDPYVEVESVTWQRGNLVIAGLAYVPSIDISKRRYTNKIVILRPRRKFRPPIVSLASSWRHPRATQISGQERYDYAWAGFRCEISSRWFRVAGRWLTGDWDCFILVRGHGVWRPARLHSPALGDAGRPGVLELDMLLELAGIAAHASERPAAPITCWLVGRVGLDPRDALAAGQRLAGDSEAKGGCWPPGRVGAACACLECLSLAETAGC